MVQSTRWSAKNCNGKVVNRDSRSSKVPLRLIISLVYKRTKTAIVVHNKNSNSTANITCVSLRGPVKSGTTPFGGCSAGPFNNASSEAGVCWVEEFMIGIYWLLEAVFFNKNWWYELLRFASDVVKSEISSGFMSSPSQWSKFGEIRDFEPKALEKSINYVLHKHQVTSEGAQSVRRFYCGIIHPITIRVCLASWGCIQLMCYMYPAIEQWTREML